MTRACFRILNVGEYTLERITSNTNSNVKEYIKLRDSKSYRNKNELFVIESLKLIKEALDCGVIIEKAFVTSPSKDKYYEILQNLFENSFENTKNTKIYEITDDINKKMSITGNSQGVFAVCKKLDKNNLMDKINIKGKYIFLSHLQDTGNVGTIIRTALAFGVNGVILSSDTCDIYSLKVLRASMGGVFKIKFFISDDVVRDLKNLSKNFSTYSAVLDKDATDILNVNFSDNSIVVIGNEGNGLCQEEINACEHKVTIMMKGDAESLNASIASSILMWEMMKNK